MNMIPDITSPKYTEDTPRMNIISKEIHKRNGKILSKSKHRLSIQPVPKKTRKSYLFVPTAKEVKKHSKTPRGTASNLLSSSKIISQFTKTFDYNEHIKNMAKNSNKNREKKSKEMYKRFHSHRSS